MGSHRKSGWGPSSFSDPFFFFWAGGVLIRGVGKGEWCSHQRCGEKGVACSRASRLVTRIGIRGAHRREFNFFFFFQSYKSVFILVVYTLDILSIELNLNCLK